MVGGMVLLAAGGTAAAIKLTQKDAQRIEQHTSASVEELTEEELVAAMRELDIKSIELDDNDRAAVILYSSGGGSGTFYELHVLLERDGHLQGVAWTQLGDRVQINSLAIGDNQIVVDMITQGPDYPMCCPTQQVVQTYAVQGDELVQTSG